ncbi:MAG: phospholipase D-like domain-containing protein [Devosia sp.]
MAELDAIVTPQSAWRVEHADRLTVIVDAHAYFVAAKEAMIEARQSVLLIGWDFDTRLPLEPAGATIEGPNALGEFLKWLPERRKGLHVHLLKWDLGVFEGLERGMLPIFITDLLTKKDLTLKLDAAHPVGAAHHSKIVVIDDSIAFCGGIDMTAHRWDTPAHDDEDPARVALNGEPTQPWHDVTTAVTGNVARALGDLARERWRLATGDTITPPDPREPIWPASIKTTLTDTHVAIARTYPDYNGQPEVREVEALYLNGIAAAKHTLYIESQYLASEKLTDALAARLAEEDGPEIILVLPRTSEGWLRQKAMDGARRQRLNQLWEADVHGRFAAYYPVTEGGTPIYVHAKVMVVDDRAMRVGSSNLNNRSMGFDTECDLMVDAGLCKDAVERERIHEAVLSVRDDLIGEHLWVKRARLSEAIKANDGSLLRAIDALMSEGRTLCRFSPEVVDGEDSIITDNALADPDAAATLSVRLKDGTVALMEQIAERLR